MYKKETKNKLMQVLISEKRFDPQKIDRVLESDLYKVIKNYMDIDREDIRTQLVLEDDGCYVLRCKVRARRIKIFGVL